MLKVTVVVETSDARGHSEEFRAELDGPAGLELAGHSPIYAEHLIAEVGAHLVRKIAAVYGDNRDDPVKDAVLPRLRRLRPLSDFEKAREAAKQGKLGLHLPAFDRDLGVQVLTAMTALRAQIEGAVETFMTNLDSARHLARQRLKEEAEANGSGETATG